MSVLTVSDIISINLLSELNLNPVWEKWRSYFLAGSFFSSLFPFYMTLNGVDLQCVPVRYSKIGENISLNSSCSANWILSTSQTEYVNSQCAVDGMLWHQRNAGAILIGITMLIQVASWMWPNYKDVRDGIKTFSQKGEKLLQQVLSDHEMETLCSKPFTREESNDVVLEYRLQEDGYELKRHKEVQEFVRFCKGHARKDFMYRYVIRNIILIVPMAVALIGCGVWMAKTSDVWNKNFKCQMYTSSAILCKEFICTNNSAMTIKEFIIVYCVTLGVQIICVGYAICCVGGEPLQLVLSRKDPENTSLRLLAEFWESANSIQSGLLKKLIDHVHPEELNYENDTGRRVYYFM